MVLATAMSTVYDTPDQQDVNRGGRLVTTQGAPLPLKAAHLEVDAKAGLARSVLTQRFVNESDTVVKVQYLLPLPSDGAVSGFSFTIGDERVVGEVDTKKQARARYDQALIEGRTAAIVDQVRSSLFEQEVGNIPPGEEVVAEIIVDQPLKWLEEGVWEWRFPTVVGARYMGAPKRVQAARRMTVDVSQEELEVRMALELAIRDDLRANGRPESPSHRLKIEERGRIWVSFAEGGARLNRDVVVRWPVAALKPGASLDVTRPAADALGGDAFGLLTLVPPDRNAAFEPVARDLVVLVDVSGSMGGEPLEQAKRVVGAVVDTLSDKDRIELIKFANRPERFRKEPIAATRDGKRAAHKWIAGLRSSGCTEMRDAIIEALTPLRGDCQRQILLVTDGYIGFEAEIVEEIRHRLPRASRLHTIGVGSAVNRTLTQGAARAGAGLEVIIAPGEDAERAAQRMVVRTDRPVVTEVAIEGDAVLEHAPTHAPDLFARCPSQIMLRLSGKGGEVVIRGKTADGELVQRLSYPAMALGEGPGQVAARFGRERVEDLEMMLAGGTPRREVDAQIEKLGLDFQIATRKTSWVAVSQKVRVKPGSKSQTVRQPHEAPQDVSLEGMGLRMADVNAAYGAMAKTGALPGGAPMGVARRTAARRRSAPTLGMERAMPAQGRAPSPMSKKKKETDEFSQLASPEAFDEDALDFSESLSQEDMLDFDDHEEEVTREVQSEFLGGLSRFLLEEDQDEDDQFDLEEAGELAQTELPGSMGDGMFEPDEVTEVPSPKSRAPLAAPPPPPAPSWSGGSFAPPPAPKPAASPAGPASRGKKEKTAFRAEAEWDAPEPAVAPEPKADSAPLSVPELSAAAMESLQNAPASLSADDLRSLSESGVRAKSGAPEEASLARSATPGPLARKSSVRWWVFGALIVLAILLGWFFGLRSGSKSEVPQTPVPKAAPASEAPAHQMQE